MRDLESAVKQLRALEKERADILRQAAHDLRGSVGVITNATAVLARTTSEEMRTDFFRILDRAIGSTQSLLGDLIDLNRLEAGQDRVQITTFDVSVVLRDLSESLRAEATARNLFLKVEGPASLLVRGDSVKLQRIVQNLVLNALKATDAGRRSAPLARGTGQSRAGSSQLRTRVLDCAARMRPHSLGPCVKPPIRRTKAKPLSTRMTSRVSVRVRPPCKVRLRPATGESANGVVSRELGEGIGLSIVKRLCELLGAAIELETEPGRGTRFRLTFPTDMPVPGAN